MQTRKQCRWKNCQRGENPEQQSRLSRRAGFGLCSEENPRGAEQLCLSQRMLWQGCSGQRGSSLCRVWAAATQGHLLLAVTLLRSKGGAGRGKTWAGPEQDGRRQLTPHLCSRDALSLAGLSRCRVQARSHLLSWLWGWKNKKVCLWRKDIT